MIKNNSKEKPVKQSDIDFMRKREYDKVEHEIVKSKLYWNDYKAKWKWDEHKTVDRTVLLTIREFRFCFLQFAGIDFETIEKWYQLKPKTLRKKIAIAKGKIERNQFTKDFFFDIFKDTYRKFWAPTHEPQGLVFEDGTLKIPDKIKKIPLRSTEPTFKVQSADELLDQLKTEGFSFESEQPKVETLHDKMMKGTKFSRKEIN